MRKKPFIFKPEVTDEAVRFRLPQGFERFDRCYLTETDHSHQYPDQHKTLHLGRDYEIRNGMFYSRKKDLISDHYILVEQVESFGKKCKICRRENDGGSFCSHCGTYLF